MDFSASRASWASSACLSNCGTAPKSCLATAWAAIMPSRASLISACAWRWVLSSPSIFWRSEATSARKFCTSEALPWSSSRTSAWSLTKAFSLRSVSCSFDVRLFVCWSTSRSLCFRRSSSALDSSARCFSNSNFSCMMFSELFVSLRSLSILVPSFLSPAFASANSFSKTFTCSACLLPVALRSLSSRALAALSKRMVALCAASSRVSSSI
mmetsp:Transcript_26597/g.88193  ORF Transcript_26597/g.88193 Transcript_26597/m.88193 type:complete len:212 (-) Transcript_26597:875-1510(-)